MPPKYIAQFPSRPLTERQFLLYAGIAAKAAVADVDLDSAQPHALHYAVLNIAEHRLYARRFEHYGHFVGWLRQHVHRWQRAALGSGFGEALVNPLTGWDDSAGRDTGLPLSPARRQIRDRSNYRATDMDGTSVRSDIPAGGFPWTTEGTPRRRRGPRSKIECPFCAAVLAQSRTSCQCGVTFPAGVECHHANDNEKDNQDTS